MKRTMKPFRFLEPRHYLNKSGRQQEMISHREGAKTQSEPLFPLPLTPEKQAPCFTGRGNGKGQVMSFGTDDFFVFRRLSEKQKHTSLCVLRAFAVKTEVETSNTPLTEMIQNAKDDRVQGVTMWALRSMVKDFWRK